MSGSGKPRFSGKAPEYRHMWLIQTSRIVTPVPIYVWVTEATEAGKAGWSGWLETQRKPGAAVLPSFWAKGPWKETSAAKAAEAREAAKAAAVKAKLDGPAVPQAPSKTLTGKEIREAAIAKGLKDRAAKATAALKAANAKPSVAKVEAKPEPEPEPTGTDPGTGQPSEAVTVATAIETAVVTLATVAQALRRQEAETQGKARPVAVKPGLRKAKPAPTPVVKRKAARR